MVEILPEISLECSGPATGTSSGQGSASWLLLRGNDVEHWNAHVVVCV